MKRNYTTEIKPGEGIVVTQITIPIVTYERLLADADLLQALQEGGVDNWEGYSFAIEEWERRKKEELNEIAK